MRRYTPTEISPAVAFVTATVVVLMSTLVASDVVPDKGRSRLPFSWAQVPWAAKNKSTLPEREYVDTPAEGVYCSGWLTETLRVSPMYAVITLVSLPTEIMYPT
eukprot:3600978-Rhodomonas_salina.1